MAVGTDINISFVVLSLKVYVALTNSVLILGTEDKVG